MCKPLSSEKHMLSVMSTTSGGFIGLLRYILEKEHIHLMLYNEVSRKCNSVT